MNWLKDNLLGMVLVGTSGVSILLALVMTIVWNLPLSVDTGELGAIGQGDGTPERALGNC